MKLKTLLKWSPMSLYADYIKEHRNDECIESDKGFCTYRYLNNDQVYIVDIYVVPSHRKSKTASDLADLVAQVAKSKGCKEVLGTVVPGYKGSTDSLRVLLGYGMSLSHIDGNMIVFKKDL